MYINVTYKHIHIHTYTHANTHIQVTLAFYRFLIYRMGTFLFLSP